MKSPLLYSILAGILVIATTGFSDSALSSSFVRLDVAELNQLSDRVVEGRVAHIESAWSESGTMIYTYVTLELSNTFKGPHSPTIEIRVPGGKVGDVSVQAAGVAEFQLDQQVVVFVGRWEDGTPRVAGYAQGLSRVVRDSRGQDRLLGGAAHGQSVAQLAKQVNPAGGLQP